MQCTEIVDMASPCSAQGVFRGVTCDSGCCPVWTAASRRGDLAAGEACRCVLVRRLGSRIPLRCPHDLLPSVGTEDHQGVTWR